MAGKGVTGDKGYTAPIGLTGGKPGKSPGKKFSGGAGYSGQTANYGLKAGVKSAASTFKKANAFPAKLSGAGGAGKGKSGAVDPNKRY